MTVPSADTPTAVDKIQLPGVFTSFWRSCLPVLAVQRKAWLDSDNWLVSEVPTITLPSRLAARARLSGPPRVPISCMPVDSVQTNARQKPLTWCSPTITEASAEIASASLPTPGTPIFCSPPAADSCNSTFDQSPLPEH